MRALAELCGADGLPPSEHAQRLAGLIGAADHLVFVLLDGLGAAALGQAPRDSFLARHQAETLLAVYPSATASAVTTLATGAWPADHAVPGWYTYLPEHELTAVSLPFVERFQRRPLAELGVTTDVYPLPGLLGRMQREARCFQPARIVDSDYSRYFCAGVENTGYGGLAEAVERVVTRVAGAVERGSPSYTYLYVPDLDEAGHTFGPLAPEVRRLLAEIDGLVAELAAGLERVAGGSQRLVLSADHGAIVVAEERRHVLTAQDPLLEELLVPPTGEPRAPVFHVRPGREAAFRKAFLERFGERFALLSLEEAEALELFGPGPLGPLMRQRLGQFVAVAGGDDVIVHRPGEVPAGPERMLGHHGGLSPAEMEIPLVLAPAAE